MDNGSMIQMISCARNVKNHALKDTFSTITQERKYQFTASFKATWHESISILMYKNNARPFVFSPC